MVIRGRLIVGWFLYLYRDVNKREVDSRVVFVSGPEEAGKR